jgi:hypothetical protein
MKTAIAENLESTLDDQQTQAILEIFNRIGIRNWLEQNPFKELKFVPKVYMEMDNVSVEVSGFYSYQQRKAEVGLLRDNEEYKKFLQWGRTQKLSHTGQTLLQAIQITLLHELGHHIHAQLREIGSSEFVVAMQLPRTNAVTNYAKSPRPVEYFAETFAAWVLYRPQLSKRDTLGYAMISRALKILSIEVNEYEFNP